jgi:adenylate kinase family enzyme
MTNENGPLVGIVGPCGAGKSTLANRLIEWGCNARAIAQEHSYVPNMWQRLTNPDILIFLQASDIVGAQRRNMTWIKNEWEEQQRRLRHAFEHADFFLDTDHLTISSVLQHVRDFLETHKIDRK